MEKKKKFELKLNLKLAVFVFIFLLCSIILNINTKADTIVYENRITDESSIQDDFQLLGLEYKAYYKSEKYLDKPEAYLIAYAESYIEEAKEDKDIQSYLYIYTPHEYKYILSIEFKYMINNNNKLSYIAYKLDSSDNGLIKIKFIKYKSTDKDNITINLASISYIYDNNNQAKFEFNNGLKYNDTESLNVICNHYNNSETLEIEVEFNSVLIIDKYEAVCVPIFQDDNINNYINNLFNSGETAINLFFYNFNFPDSIKVDSVEYAKFSYYYNTYQDRLISGVKDSTYQYQKKLIEKEYIVNEYSNTSKKVRVNDNSVEVDFPIFALENRIEAGQFNNYQRIYDNYKNNFNYDCSVLIDSTIKTANVTNKVFYNQIDYEYTLLDDIDLLELHYKANGKTYKSKVIVDKVEEEDVTGTDTSKDELEKKPTNNNDTALFDSLLSMFNNINNNNFFKWFVNNLPNSFIVLALL
nr:hypothetical protein [Acholeplasmatales bacterium]